MRTSGQFQMRWVPVGITEYERQVQLKVFTLNTQLHPQSANALDSLAECHAALGDAAIAASLYAKSRQLAEAAKAKP